MMRRIPVIVLALAAASGRAVVEDASSSRFVAFIGGAGAASLLGYESSSTFAATFGPSTGKPLNTSYASAIRGGTASGFGMVIGGRRGQATGYFELSYAVVRTKAQDVSFDREGSTYDPVNGYVPLDSGTTRLPAGWLRVSSSALFVGFNLAPWNLALAPYAGLGLGVSLMHATSGWMQGEDGGTLDERKFGIGAHVSLGLRLAPEGEMFGYLEIRPGWHFMSPYNRGTDWSRTKDQFVLQLTQVLVGIGWQWE